MTFLRVALLCPIVLAASLSAAPVTLPMKGVFFRPILSVEWVELLTMGRSLELASDAAFSDPKATVMTIPSDPRRRPKDFDTEPDLQIPVIPQDAVWFWRFKDSRGSVRSHPGMLIVVPAGQAGRLVSFGVDFSPRSRWVVRASRVSMAALGKESDSGTDSSDSEWGRGTEKTYFVSGNSLLLTPQDFAVQYLIQPAEMDPAFKQTSGKFIGLRVGKTIQPKTGGWVVEERLFPPTGSDESEFVGPLASVIDVREPTRESISTVRLLGRYLVEDLKMERDLDFDVRGAKSIGGSLRIEDVAFYPASIFAEFEWHGVTASYAGASSSQPPELIKQVFGGISVGYDVAKHVSKLSEQSMALHVGPQFSIASVPVANDFEPTGLVGLRLQPQWIRSGAVWQGTIEYAVKKDSRLNRLSAGYTTCRYFSVCLSGEAYLRQFSTSSGSDKTDLSERGIGIGIGTNL